MTNPERQMPRIASQLALIWSIFVLIGLGLQILIQHSALWKGELSWTARIASIAYDFLLIWPFLLVLGLPVLWLGARSVQVQRRVLRAAMRGLQILLVWLILLAYGAQWATFYTTQQFLSYEGFLFWIEQPVQVFHWISIPFAGSITLATLITAILFCLALPRILSNPVSVRRRVWLGGLFCLCLTAAVVGEFGPMKNLPLEPDNLSVYRQMRRYLKLRDYQAGPFAFGLSSLRATDLEAGHPFPEDKTIPMTSHPIISIQEYASGVDRSRFKPRNVILILIESLRSDQLHLYGADRDVLPTINAMSREARVFLKHYSQASHSNYADLPPLSSHYPLRSRQAYSYPKQPTYPRVLIYDILKALGYRTAIFSSQNENWGAMINYLDTGTLDRFSHAANFDGPTYVMLEDVGFADWVRKTKHAGSVDDRFTIAESIEWISSVGKEPFFLYLNLQNSHVPYVVPEEFPRRFGPETVDFAIRFASFPRNQAEVVKDRYADSLFYIDSRLALLFDYLRRNRLWDETVLVVTADTGQAFYEHGFASHASQLYDEVMKVPLLIRAPELEPALDKRPAQHVDVPPSILHLLGLPSHPGFQGVNLFEEQWNPDRSLYMVVQTALAYQHAMIRGDMKLIYDEQERVYEAFHLVVDPGEESDLAAFQPKLVESMAGRLHRWYREQIDYYADESRHRQEYPPILSDD